MSGEFLSINQPPEDKGGEKTGKKKLTDEDLGLSEEGLRAVKEQRESNEKYRNENRREFFKSAGITGATLAAGLYGIKKVYDWKNPNKQAPKKAEGSVEKKSEPIEVTTDPHLYKDGETIRPHFGRVISLAFRRQLPV
jgi:hypothetical protein